MKKYSEIKIGDKEFINHTITQNDIEKFVQLTGDDNRLHVDEQFARATHFKKPVVHGMLGASFISTVIGTKLPGDGALWFSQTLEFLLPVRIGDDLIISAEVVKKNDSEQIIELKTEISNQNRQIVTKGLAKVKVTKIENSQVEETISIKEYKNALIIGGTGGIGRATCLQLAKDGFNIIIHYHKNKILAEEIKSEIELLNISSIVVQADISKEADIQEMIAKSIRKFGKIDVVVNCASTHIPNIKFSDLMWSDFLQQMELNIRSTVAIIQAVSPGMISNGYGKIITIGSMTSDKPNSDWAHYITAKSALIGLTKSIAYELAPKGINVNIVTPSLLDTDLTSDIPEKIKLLTAAQTPLRRLAKITDIANVISFLSSTKSDFLTGENIRINGGQVMI